MHGVAGSRFGPLSDWGWRLAARGSTALVVATRGSDRVWEHGGRKYGGAYERLAEAPLDLGGATDALRALGHRRFILAGQSLGAVKVVVTQATAPLDGVVGVVPKSGPSFAPAALARCGAPFAQAMGAAQARVAAGEPEALLDVEAPIKGQMGAAAFVDKYGPRGRSDWVGLLERVAVPTLVILGGADPSPLVGWARETVQLWPQRPPSCEVRIMPGWGHGFEAPGEAAVALRRARRRLVGAREGASARPIVNRGRGGIRRRCTVPARSAEAAAQASRTGASPVSMPGPSARAPSPSPPRRRRPRPARGAAAGGPRRWPRPPGARPGRRWGAR